METILVFENLFNNRFQATVVVFGVLLAAVSWVVNARSRLRPQIDNIVYPGWFQPALAASIAFTSILLSPGATGWLTMLLCIASIVFAVMPTSNKILMMLRLVLGEPWERARRAPPPALSDCPKVAVIVASCNEPFDVCKMTFDSAMLCNYPGPIEIIWVDNSPDTTTSSFLRLRAYIEQQNERRGRPDFSAKFVHNTRPGGFKPGNLDLALEHTDAEYLFYLDVDSTVPRDASGLTRAIEQMISDPKLGYVQFWSVAVNGDYERDGNRMAAANASYLFFVRAWEAMRGHGAFPTCHGHNMLWRRQAVVATGPWLDHFRGQVMVTEDLLKGFRAFCAGYYGKADFWPVGEWAPNTLRSTDAMWRRWTYGSLQVFEKYVGEFFTAKAEMTARERFDFLQLITCYLAPAVLTLANMLGLLDMSLGTPAQISELWIWLCLAYWICLRALPAMLYHRHWLAAEQGLTWGQKAHRLVLVALTREIVEHSMTIASISYVVRARQGWRPTGKGREDGMRWLQLLREQRAMFLLCFTKLAVVFVMPCGLLGKLVLALWALTSLVAVVLFARDRKEDDSAAAHAHVDAIAWRYAGGPRTAPALAAAPEPAVDAFPDLVRVEVAAYEVTVSTYAESTVRARWTDEWSPVLSASAAPVVPAGASGRDAA